MDDLRELAIAWLLLAVPGLVVLGGFWLRARRQDTPIRWLPLPRGRRISWNGIDVVVIFVLLLLLPSVVHGTLKQSGVFDWLYGENDDPATRGRQLLWSSAFAAPLQVAFILLGLHCVRRSRPGEFGLNGVGALPNIALGFLLWCVLTPAALLLYEAVLQVTPQEFIEPHWLTVAGLQALELDEWTMLFLGAVLLAPLVEELVFRGLLLPWQLRGGWEAQASVAFFALVVAAMGGFRGESKDYNPLPLVFVAAMLPGLVVLPSLRHRQAAEPADESTADTLTPPVPVEAVTQQLPGQREQGSTLRPGVAWQQRFERQLADILRSAAAARAQPGLAIYTNGLLFAAMHSAVWPSPLPLFLVGLGLAWLKVRTNSLVGCLTLHALFNAASVLALMLAKEDAG